MDFVTKKLLPWLIKIIKPELEKAIKTLVASLIALVIALIFDKIKSAIERGKKYEKQAEEADQKAAEAEASEDNLTAENWRKEADKLREIAKVLSEELNDLKYKVETISKNAMKEAEARIGDLELQVDGEAIALNIPARASPDGRPRSDVSRG